MKILLQKERGNGKVLKNLPILPRSMDAV